MRARGNDVHLACRNGEVFVTEFDEEFDNACQQKGVAPLQSVSFETPQPRAEVPELSVVQAGSMVAAGLPVPRMEHACQRKRSRRVAEPYRSARSIEKYQRKLASFALLNFDYWICLLITAIGDVLVIAYDRGRRIKWHRLRPRL